MKRRTPPGHCSCGAKCIDTFDNHGEPMKGCPNCRIMSLDEINAILRKGGYVEVAPAMPRRVGAT